jgi:hypothetical protein|tara:strand:- start:538 stop:852 length:315 start_codon:yes stop_codon:yes gene_type:complete
MANPWRKIVFPVTGSATTKITGSIYKVCSNGATETIYSASFGWQNEGTRQLDPAPASEGLKFDLHYHDNAGDTCIEADFSHISCSIGTHVYIKTNSGQGWTTNE